MANRIRWIQIDKSNDDSAATFKLSQNVTNNVVAETDGTGAITEEILWGHQPLARKINGSWYYYIYNAHGDVVGLVNEAGTVVNTYEYTPWWEIRN